MKKALIYTLAVALLLSLAACHRPQTDQQNTEPEPPQVEATIPEAETTPEPEPEEAPAVPEEWAKEAIKESMEADESHVTEITSVDENGRITYTTAEGMGVIDPDNTPADVYSSDGLTEQEKEELQQRFQEEVHVDENLPEITEETIDDELAAFLKEKEAHSIGLDMSGKDYSPESTSKGYTEGWTEKYN